MGFNTFWVFPNFNNAILNDVKFFPFIGGMDNGFASLKYFAMQLRCQPGALGQIQIIANSRVSQKLRRFIDFYQFILINRCVELVAEAGQAQVGGYLAAGDIWRFKMGPMSSFGNNA